SEQSRDLSERRTAARVLPFTQGTTQCGTVTKVAVTSVHAPASCTLAFTWHFPVPAQASQPLKADQASGVAIRVTEVHETYAASQADESGPQLIPAGSLLTVPSPVPSS